MTKKHYDQEFKKTIVSLYESGKTIEELCSEFKISISSVNRWRKEYGESKEDHSIEDKQRIKALEKELKSIKLERDILKKAVSIFSTNDR